MARYTGPVCRLCRREGMKLYLKGARCDGPKCPIVKRQPARRFSARSAWTAPNKATVRVRTTSCARSKKCGGSTGSWRVSSTSTCGGRAARRHWRQPFADSRVRLDNVVYRMGFADSRRQARQLVRHGHFMVNDRKTNIPSFLVKPGDVVTVRPGSRGRTYFTDYGEVLETRRAPDWMTIDSRAAQRQDSQSAGSRPDRSSDFQRSVGRGALQPLVDRPVRVTWLAMQ